MKNESERVKIINNIIYYGVNNVSNCKYVTKKQWQQFYRNSNQLIVFSILYFLAPSLSYTENAIRTFDVVQHVFSLHFCHTHSNISLQRYRYVYYIKFTNYYHQEMITLLYWKRTDRKTRLSFS